MNNRLAVCLLALACGAGSTDVYAQKWLKNLGKALDTTVKVLGGDEAKETKEAEKTAPATKLSNADKAPAGRTVTPAANTVPAGNGSCTQTAGIPGMTTKVTRVEHWGEHVLVRFVIQNSLEYEYTTFMDGKSVAYDADGNTYDVWMSVGGRDGLGMSSSGFALPTGVPVKGFIQIRNVPARVKQFSQIQLGGRAEQKDGRKEFVYTLENITVADPVKNTNADNAVCSLPNMFLSFQSCQRMGNDVVLKFSLKNQTEVAYGISMQNSTFYDEEGNTYEPVLKAPGLSFGNMTLQPNIPAVVTATIKNVPSSVTSLSQARVKFSQNRDAYYVEVTNQPISAQ